MTHCPISLEEIALFYIDDRAITGTDARRLQAGLDIIIRSFESFGLLMNASKSKCMIMSGGKFNVKQLAAAYCCTVMGEGQTY